MTRIRIFSWLIALPVLFGGSPAVRAQCDSAAPQLVGFDFNPKSVDVTAGDKLVTLTFDLTDDVAGVDLVGVTLLSPSTIQTVKCNSDIPLSGTPVNGTYQCTATMPEFSESGTWVIDQISKSDRVTRSESVFTDDLMLLGLPFELEVTSVPDVSPPMLTGLAVSTVAVDTSTGAALISCDINATDNLAGISLVFCKLTAPSEVGRTGCAALIPSSGTPTNGLFSCTMEVPRYSETDDWELSVELLDAVDNGTESSPQDLATAGFPDQVAVTSTPEDLLPPVLVDFDLQPVQVNVEDADRIVTCTARLTDALAGNAIFGCSGTFIDGAFNIITQACTALAPDSGTVDDGIWSCDLMIPQYSPGGTWGFVTAVFIDAVGNSAFADSTLLQGVVSRRPST